jgi:hypothetical protein
MQGVMAPDQAAKENEKVVERVDILKTRRMK